MTRLRLLLVWLVVAALPLQGFAAAGMLFCGLEQATDVSRSVVQAVPAGYSQDAAPERLAAAHDHSGHGHATLGHAKSSPGAEADQHQHQHGHGCPTCASCCHVVAVGGFETIPRTTAAPSVEPSAPLVRVATRTTSVPDKPPRA